MNKELDCNTKQTAAITDPQDKCNTKEKTMATNLLDFLINFVGTYTPKVYTVTEKIMCANPITGAITTEEWTYDVIPTGIGSIDGDYIARFVLLLMILRVLYNIPKWTLQIIKK